MPTCRVPLTVNVADADVDEADRSRPPDALLLDLVLQEPEYVICGAFSWSLAIENLGP